MVVRILLSNYFQISGSKRKKCGRLDSIETQKESQVTHPDFVQEHNFGEISNHFPVKKCEGNYG